uniref:Uncharacterized protein n=1 Tax=Solanum tuberosum TaxID=4113 RepID=M1DHU0_SOLTU
MELGEVYEKGDKAVKMHLATTHHDHEGLHDPWWPPRAVVPPVVGEAVSSQGCPKEGSPSRATSRLVLMTMDSGNARGVAFTTWEVWQVEGATGQGTTGTTMGRGALDGS